MSSPLPSELILLIAENLPSQADINSLTRTCRRARDILNPFLYSYNLRHGDGSAILWAAKNGFGHIVGILLAQGAQPNFSNNKGQTALSLAAEFGHVGVMRILLEHGASPLIDESSHLPHNSMIEVAAEEGKTAVVNSILTEFRSGTYSSEVESFAHSQANKALRRAAYNGQEETAICLLENHGACINDRENGWVPTGWVLGSAPREMETPLSIAAEQGQVSMVQLLLERGADPNIQLGPYYETALGCAVFMGNERTARLLLDYGADTKSCPSAFATAFSRNNPSMVRLLLSRGLTPDGRAFSSVAIRPQCLQVLFDAGVTIPPEAVWRAAVDDEIEAVRLLLQKRDVNVNGPLLGSKGWQMYSILSRGSVAMLKLLLAHGATLPVDALSYMRLAITAHHTYPLRRAREEMLAFIMEKLGSGSTPGRQARPRLYF
jgi:ankyrin repeat protein